MGGVMKGYLQEGVANIPCILDQPVHYLILPLRIGVQNGTPRPAPFRVLERGPFGAPKGLFDL